MEQCAGMEICVLLIQHRACALTRHHFAILQSLCGCTPEVQIVPITFPEYARNELLPGTWISEKASFFRSNSLPDFQRFHHAGGPLVTDLDCLVWDFVLNSGQKADRIILAEGDMLARCGMREFFEASFQHEISGSVVRRGIAQNKDWWWYGKTPAAEREQIGDRVASITPVCGIQMSWDLAERMARLVVENPGRFDNMHVEMAFGTLARLVGAEPGETLVPEGQRSTEFIDFTPSSLRLGNWGIFHPVKHILQEGHGLPFRERANLDGWSIGPDDYDWLVAWCRDHWVKRVVEFGPGDSTLAFLEAGCTVLAAEHDDAWRRLAIDRFSRDPGVEVISYEDVPGCGFPRLDWMPDLVFVDGPPSSGPNGRWHTLRWAMQHADTVVIHDACRDAEKELLSRAVTEEWTQTILPTAKGLALLQRNPDAAPRQLPPERGAHARYAGLKKWGWYLDDLPAWRAILATGQKVRALEIGAFDGVSANLMLDLLFTHPDSEVHCIDPYEPDPTTPQVCAQTKADFLENLRIGGHENRIHLYEGISVEVLAWMLAAESFWESFDFIYVDGSHIAKDVLTDATMCWNLLKPGGVIAFDDYEWNCGGDPLGRPKAGIDAFERVFRPHLQLLRGGWRRLWSKFPPAPAPD